MRATISGLIAAATLGAGPAAAAEQGFKGWWTVCDNTRECVAFAFPSGAHRNRPICAWPAGRGRQRLPVLYRSRPR